MAISLQLEPELETRLEEEARKLGISKSEFVIDALERTLGMKNPAELLSQVRSGKPMGNPKASESVRSNLRNNITDTEIKLKDIELEELSQKAMSSQENNLQK